jgi:hypothetical protein
MQEAMNEAANMRHGGHNEGSRDLMESFDSNDQSLDVLRPQKRINEDSDDDEYGMELDYAENNDEEFDNESD